VAKKKTAAEPATATPPPGSAPGPNGRRPKTVCLLTAAEFAAEAGPVTVTVGGHPLTAEPKEFSTGSFGYFVNGKVVLDVAGRKVPCQVNCNVVLVGSKEADRGF
jgi:hypothetical protein